MGPLWLPKLKLFASNLIRHQSVLHQRTQVPTRQSLFLSPVIKVSLFFFQQKLIEKIENLIESSNFTVKTRAEVPDSDPEDDNFKRKKIVLRANHFKLKIKAQNVWQYKLAFLHPDKGPAIKTKEERRGIFDAFIDQYVNDADKMNVSGTFLFYV